MNYDAAGPAARALAAAARLLDEAAAINGQQGTLLRHLLATARHLHALVAGLPPGAETVLRALPLLGDDFRTRVPVLAGYARMLLQDPEATFSPAAREQLEIVHEAGMALLALTEHTAQEAGLQRQHWRQQGPERFDLAAALHNGYWELLCYWLKGLPVRPVFAPAAGLPPVYAERYHVLELIGHLVLTPLRELETDGQLELTLLPEQGGQRVRAAVFCGGLRLTPDELHTLFTKDGRHIYRRQLERWQGQAHLLQAPRPGAAVSFVLPAAGYAP